MAESTAASTTPQRPVQVKLVLLGDAGVGKSSVVLRFVQNDFQENKEPTIGAAFLTQKCRLEDKVIKFEIWDTAGQERFHSLAPMYYRNAQAAVVAYDLTNGPSLDKAKSWVKELQRQANPNIVIALIGNKLDLVGSSSPSAEPSSSDADADANEADAEADDATATPTKPSTTLTSGNGAGKVKRQVAKEEAEAYAQEAGLLFFETSAKTGEGVVEVFTEIAKKIPIEHILSSTAGGNANRRTGQASAAGGQGAGAGANNGGRVRLGGAGGAAGEGNKEGCAC